MNFHKTLIIMAVSAALLPSMASSGRAQDAQASQPSLAEAARKARQEQKSQPKSAKVYTDEDLSDLKGQISIVGNEPPTPAANNEPAPAAKPAPKQPVKNEAYWRARFAEARRTLADDSKELDILQREFHLDEVQYYANPNEALQQQYSRKDLNDKQAAIDAKKKDVDKDNQVLSDLQDELRTSGGEPGWANEPSSNESQDSQSSPSDSSQSSESDRQSTASDPSAPASQPAGDTGATAASQPQ